MAKQMKTPEYTRRAAKNYRDKHDYMNITFDKGEPDALRSVGITPAVIRELVRAEYKRRTDGAEESFMPKPTDGE